MDNLILWWEVLLWIVAWKLFDTLTPLLKWFIEYKLTDDK
jgi:hypothetical protein